VADKVLFIVNDPVAPPAMLGEAFAELGYDVHTFDVLPADGGADPVVDVTFPDPLDYDAIVPLGARWSVYDERIVDGWVADEQKLLRDADAEGVGVLGVCFGGQLLATAHGGSVARSPEPELGWYDVHTDRPELIPAGRWFQWHYDRFEIPPGATLVASNPRAPQAFVVGRGSLGLQFHPELDGPLLEAWLTKDAAELAEFGLSLDDVRATTAELVDDARDRLRALTRGFRELRNQPRPS
jgi:GMP synthase-like glutamine amidotransferase